MQTQLSFQSNFVARLDNPFQLGDLLNFLPEVFFYAKDRTGRFVKVNLALAQLRGFRHEWQMIGLNDFDLHPRRLAEEYVAEDHRVMERGTPLPNQTWLVPDQAGRLKWFVSTKIPLFGDGGQVIGVAGVMRDFEKTDSFIRPYQGFGEVLSYVMQHYGEELSVQLLAEQAGLSISQFDRRFKQTFQVTPQQYILRVRLNAACEALVSTNNTIAAIALKTGFYDQSYFAKQFKRQFGISPLKYRQKYKVDGSELMVDG